MAGMRKDGCVKKIEGDWGCGEKIGMARMGKGKGGENGVRENGEGMKEADCAKKEKVGDEKRGTK